MEGESPRLSHDRVLLNAVLLSILGLYETIELMKKEDDDEYWVADHSFNVRVHGSTFSLSMYLLRKEFDYQFRWFSFQIRVRKKGFQKVKRGVRLGEMTIFSSGVLGG